MKLISDTIINELFYGEKGLLKHLKSVSIRIDVLEVSEPRVTLQAVVHGDNGVDLLYFEPRVLRKGDTLHLEGIKFEYEPGDIRIG